MALKLTENLGTEILRIIFKELFFAMFLLDKNNKYFIISFIGDRHKLILKMLIIYCPTIKER